MSTQPVIALPAIQGEVTQKVDYAWQQLTRLLGAMQQKIETLQTQIDTLAKTTAATTTTTAVAPVSALAGDVTGAADANTVTKIQGEPVDNTAPTNGQVLEWNGAKWVPTSLPAVNALADPGGNGIVKRTALNTTAIAAAGVDYQAPLGYTAENVAHKDAANGYPSLDAGTLIPIAEIPTIPFVHTSGVQAALGFTPENIAHKDAASGYPSLDAGTLIPIAEIPTIPFGHTSGVQAALGFTPENVANKNAASGYAGLNAGAIVPIARLATGVPNGAQFVRDDNTLAVPPGTAVTPTPSGNLGPTPGANTRVFNTTYQNTSGKAMFVTIAYVISAAAFKVLCDVGNVPASMNAIIISTSTSTVESVSFWVPNNYYYRIENTGGGTLMQGWNEWTF